jgi:hypothetical protein
MGVSQSVPPASTTTRVIEGDATRPDDSAQRCCEVISGEPPIQRSRGDARAGTAGLLSGQVLLNAPGKTL